MKHSSQQMLVHIASKIIISACCSHIHFKRRCCQTEKVRELASIFLEKLLFSNTDNKPFELIFPTTPKPCGPSGMSFDLKVIYNAGSANITRANNKSSPGSCDLDNQKKLKNITSNAKCNYLCCSSSKLLFYGSIKQI